MSKAVSHNSQNSTTTVPNWRKLPCVQYGFAEGKGPKRASKLCTIFEPIPDNAETVSPIYILSRVQYKRQQRLKTGYEVTGEYNSIATELQDECEANDRVLYPVHIESDVYHEEGPATLMEWFREFVEDYLNVPFHTCKLYFSGQRSIHAHVPRFVSGEDQREQLKKQARKFCDETGAKLDSGLYDPKRLFRLPGVKHMKSGLRKVEIEPTWDKTRIFREANTASPDVPESYEAVLRHVFVRESLIDASVNQNPYTPYDLFRVLDSGKTVLEFPSDEQEIETPLIEQIQYPDDPADVPVWAQYNAKEFSPYAHASGNERSVAVVQVKGGAFSRKGVRNGAPLIPVFFYGARGCNGKEFTKDHEHAPLQLSKGKGKDYEKWVKRGFQPGDNVVIIGGQSRSSVIFRVKESHAQKAGQALTGEEGSRQAALEYLASEGYDIGKNGTSGHSKRSKSAGTRGHYERIPSVRKPNTKAAALQQQAEQEGINTLTHNERWRVACRLLWYGWNPAWEWFKRQFGAEFDPEVTATNFRNIIEANPEDYDHVVVPK